MMIISFIFLAIFLGGLCLIFLYAGEGIRWIGLLAAGMSAFLYMIAYGYPTHRIFIPDDFYLLAATPDVIWIELKDVDLPRAIYYSPVPQEWRDALEENQGHPIRLVKREETVGEEEDHEATFSPQEYEIVNEYWMQKGDVGG